MTDGVITDVLPAGVTYIGGSATGNAEFTFQGYDATTRTLTWTADDVSEDGTVSYQATVDEGAAELIQPLINIASIDSDQTEPDEADSPVFVPTIPWRSPIRRRSRRRIPSPPHRGRPTRASR